MGSPDLTAYIELSSQVPTYARRHRGTIHAADVMIERQGRTWSYTFWVDGLCASQRPQSLRTGLSGAILGASS